MDSRKVSNRIYIAIVITLIVCNFALSFMSLDFKNEGQRTMVKWPFVFSISLWGAVGVVLARRVGFPELWDPSIPSPRKWILPLVLGVFTGLASILFDVIHPLAQLYGLKSVHHPLPEGFILYIYGALISEIVFHLLPVPLILFLFSDLMLKRKHQNHVFWITAAILSLWESRPYVVDPGQWNWIETGRNTVSYLANIFEIWLFRSFGFLAAVEQRLVSYSLWHIVWPAISGR